MDACLSCPGTPQGEGRHGGLSPAWQASTGGYRSILEQADQRTVGITSSLLCPRDGHGR